MDYRKMTGFRIIILWSDASKSLIMRIHPEKKDDVSVCFVQQIKKGLQIVKCRL